jgi:hypothetical protein
MKKVGQVVGILLLFVVAIFLVMRAFKSEEQRLVLSKASLQGTVSYKGKPVPYALVIVNGKDSSATGMADESGAYFVQHAPVGEVEIAVNTVAGRGMQHGRMMAAAMSGDRSSQPNFVDVPQKYFNPDTSGITAVIENETGNNDFDIVIQ